MSKRNEPLDLSGLNKHISTRTDAKERNIVAGFIEALAEEGNIYGVNGFKLPEKQDGVNYYQSLVDAFIKKMVGLEPKHQEEIIAAFAKALGIGAEKNQGQGLEGLAGFGGFNFNTNTNTNNNQQKQSNSNTANANGNVGGNTQVDFQPVINVINNITPPDRPSPDMRPEGAKNLSVGTEVNKATESQTWAGKVTSPTAPTTPSPVAGR